MTTRVFPFFAFLIAVLIFFGYVNPTWTGSIGATAAKIAADDQALAAASAYTARQNELASARNALDPAALARLSQMLPDSVDNVGLILDLNALAARTGLSLSSVDVSKTEGAGASGAAVPVGTNPVGSVNLSLSAVGTFGSLAQFLSGIESSLRLLDVQNISIRGSDTGVYTYRMTLRFYWLR